MDRHISTSWQDHSPLTPPVASSSLTHYPFDQSFHSAFSAAADQGVGLRSLSAFSFHSNSISQPVSYLRNPIDISNVSEQTGESSAGQIQEEHGVSYSINDLLSHEESSPNFSNSGGIAAFMLGEHRSMQRDYLSPSSGHERETPSKYQDDSKEQDQGSKDSFRAQTKWIAYLTSVTDNYGLDSGRPDQDLALNNDHAAIDINSALDSLHTAGRSESTSPKALSTGSIEQDAVSHGYYASPVPINIPRYLSPLPSTLLENPINLMYFHHFVNHTSRMLVPHDCDKNPFISVLPSSQSCELKPQPCVPFSNPDF